MPFSIWLSEVLEAKFDNAWNQGYFLHFTKWEILTIRNWKQEFFEFLQANLSDVAMKYWLKKVQGHCQGLYLKDQDKYKDLSGNDQD